MPSIAFSHKSRVYFIVALLAMTAFLSLFSISPTPVQAETTPFQELQPNLKINIPTLTPFTPIARPDAQGFIYVSYLAEYISAVYQYLVGIAGIFAVALIMWGGMKWVFAGGDAAKVTSARKTINNAVIGLVLALGSYLLLYTINPETIQFNALRLQAIPRDELLGQEQVVDSNEVTGPGGPAGDFGQFDSRWASHLYPYPSNCPEAAQSVTIRTQNSTKPCTEGSGTICSSGCATAATANVLASYGVNVTPVEVADFMAQSGNGRACSGTLYATFATALSRSPWSNFTAEKVNLERATELLAQGKPIVFHCRNCTGTSSVGTPKTRKGHFMTLVSVSNDIYRVNDPGGRGRNKVVSMTKEQVKANVGLWYLHP